MNPNPAPTGKDKYAWSEIDRVEPPKRPAAERLADFLEIYGDFDEATAREQASRCIQCPNPLCVAGCPLGNHIPEWLALTADGHFSEAAGLLHYQSSLPEIVSRVCASDGFCEAMCILNGKAEPISIRTIEQFLSDYAFVHGQSDVATAAPNGLVVAVVGTGPGGLACADALCRRGYAVTVFDWRLVAGGLLVSGTPDFRLDKSIVERRIEMLRNSGVTFRLGAKLGEDFTCAELHENFDAVYLGFGARKVRELDLPGRNLAGVEHALALLIQEPAALGGHEDRIQVSGKRVVVLGGGDMAMNSVRTALRLGAREVICVYRRDAANLSGSSNEYRNAVEEGARFVFMASPVAVLGNERGQVTGVRLLRTEPGAVETDGRMAFRVVAETEFEIAADCVFLALGFEPVTLPDESLFNTLAMNDKNGIAVDDNQMTNVPGVFAGGDVVRGPSTVLEVVRDARRAVEGIDRYLGQQPKITQAMHEDNRRASQ